MVPTIDPLTGVFAFRASQIACHVGRVGYLLNI
jgi:hypothetical protein